MIVWDRGVFENISETRSGEKLTLEEALEKGDIKVFLPGREDPGPLRPRSHLPSTKQVAPGEHPRINASSGC